MPLIGRTVFSLSDSPPRSIGLNDGDGNPIKGVKVSMRLLPKAVSEKLIRPAMQKVRKKDEEEAEEAISRWMREHTAKALVDTEGFEWSFDDAGAVDAYRSFFPGIEVGVPVTVDGKWSEDFKKKFFEDHPAVVAILLDAYKRLASIGSRENEEIEEGKGKTSQAG